MRRSVLAEFEPNDPELEHKPIADPGFNYPMDYLIRTYSWLKQFHVLPEAGGLNDQDALWIADIELYSGMRAQASREYLEYKSEQQNAGR